MIKDTINIILVDDNKRFLAGVQMLLTRNPRYKVIETLHNGQELVNSKKLPQANIVISDIDMPIINGIEAAKRVNFSYPNIPLLAITMHTESLFLKDIIEAGFKGFIHKPDIAKNLYNTIDLVLNNKFVFDYNLNISK